MSRIYFTARDVEVSGTERSHMGLLTTDLTVAILMFGVTPGRADRVRRLLPPGTYMDTVADEALADTLQCYMGGGKPLLHHVPASSVPRCSTAA